MTTETSTTPREQWLADLKPGDQVLFTYVQPMAHVKAIAAVRLTATQIVLEVEGCTYRFRRETGYCMGEYHYHYRYPRIDPATPEVIAETQAWMARQRLFAALQRVKRTDLDAFTQKDCERWLGWLHDLQKEHTHD